jgi:formamidopyrimidine-DNA glycosylase
MPELPEVQAVVTKLRQSALNAIIREVFVLREAATSPQNPLELQQATGFQIVGISRRAKNMLLELSSGMTLRIHLRMTGNLYVLPDFRFRPHSARVLLRLQDDRAIVLDDPRALGRVTIHSASELAQILDQYGLEPLSPEFTYEKFQQQAVLSRQPAKVFLLDQSRVAGLGNIWAAETLYAARVHPQTPINLLSTRKLRLLHASIVAVLSGAVQSALAVYAAPSNFPEAELLGLSVYGREGEDCSRCGNPICRIAQAGRSTYFCARCQKSSVPDSRRSGHRPHRN